MSACRASEPGHRFRVQLHDTDGAGVLFYAHLFRHAHDAYETAMERIGWPIDQLIRDRSLALPLVRAEADFRSPLRHGDEVRAAIGLEACEARHFRIGYQFWRGGDLVARAQTVHAALDPVSGQACCLPEALRDALGHMADERMLGALER